MPADRDVTMVPVEAAPRETHNENGERRWKPGDRVYAVWVGNGFYYAATVQEVNNSRRLVKVEWDDKEDSHRIVSFDQVCENPYFMQVMEHGDDTQAWSQARIDRRATVRNSETKGRCLYTNEKADPGHVVFVERPLMVALPANEPNLWKHLTELHKEEPLNLGTVTFHFAAICSLLHLDEKSIDIIHDKFVPEPDEEAGEDIFRILKSVTENGVLDLNKHPIEPKRLQRLVSAWRYNSFGHHKEDGLVLYNRISMCAHSCDPTCCWSYGEDDAFVLRARISLKRGDELTISYLQDEDLLKSTAVRQQKLQNWRFLCACPRCDLRIDLGRGFKCRRCRVGRSFSSTDNVLEPCNVCTARPAEQDQQVLLQMEQEYQTRVEALDKNDIADVEAVYQAAMEIFERHWILYVMETMLWEASKEKNNGGRDPISTHEAMEFQRRRIEFHEHYYCRPTFILAWCHEDLGDSLQNQFPHRKWHCIQEWTKAYQMLVILCGSNHQYTCSPYQKLWQVSNSNMQRDVHNKNTQAAAPASLTNA